MSESVGRYPNLLLPKHHLASSYVMAVARRQTHAMVEATGHTERDAIAILKALDAAGWVLVEKGR